MQGHAHPDPTAARSTAIFAFEGLAVHFAEVHAQGRHGLAFEDAYQSAMLAVTIAVDKFDPTRSIPLAKFVAVCIRYQLGRDLEQARRHRRCLGSHVLEAVDPVDPSAGLVDTEEFDDLYAAVDSLPAEDGALIVELYGLDGSPPISRGQLARRTGRDKNAVVRSARLSLSTLRASLTG
jgi:RNA polymerase sigma factor (sigma-70 family)